jgi:hypothetical protein
MRETRLGLTQWFNTDSGFEFNTLFNTYAIVDFGDSISGVWLLLRWLWTLSGLSGKPRDHVTYAGVPSAAQIATTLAFVGSQFKLTQEARRLADVWIEPDLSKFNLLDYHK